MKYTLLHNKSRNKRLILIFSGWSTTPDFYRDIEMAGWDTAVVWDYSDFDFNISNLDGYSTVYLYAWSLGVAAANSIDFNGKITAAFAVNGSLRPVDDHAGIPVDIFSDTATNLSIPSLQKFRLRMAGGKSAMAEMSERLPGSDDIESLRSQLLHFLDFRDSFKNNIRWNKAFLGRRDRIFPIENLRKAWQELLAPRDIMVSDNPHFTPLLPIVKETIHDLEKLKLSFTKANATYNEHASAQRKIATRLSEILREISSGHPAILEIGSGTGLFTELYLPILNPSSVDTVDIVEIAPSVNDRISSHHCADAELWMADSTGKWDMILSSSTMQWFTNLNEFIRNCAPHIKTDGRLVASLFIKGNLSELDALRPSPIAYHSREEIETMLKESFSEFHTEEEEIKIEFSSGREAMLHLKRTGVAGGYSGNRLKISDFSEIRTLTYRVLYIVASHPRNL